MKNSQDTYGLLYKLALSAAKKMGPDLQNLSFKWKNKIESQEVETKKAA